MTGTVVAGAPGAPVLAVRGVHKRFGGVHALRGVDLDVRAGEVIGLVGENGSGKSTLARLMAGAAAADTGSLSVRGRDVRWRGAADALRDGVALVAQEVIGVPTVSVTENLLTGRLPLRHGRISWSAAHETAARVLADYGVGVDPRERFGSLSLQQRQLVAVASAVARTPGVLLLDEPTSSLTDEQAELVLGRARGLADSGSAVVLVTHRLGEYLAWCDRLVVLRDGTVSAVMDAVDATEELLVRSMVGRDLPALFTHRPRPRVSRDGRRLALHDVSSGRLREVSLHVDAGEVVGIAGRAGSGRSTLARTFVGLEPYTGEIRLDGRRIRPRNPRAAMQHGVVLVPEDRKAQGLVLSGTVHDNLNLAVHRSDGRFGVRSRRAETRRARHWAERLRIRTPSLQAAAAQLSGGNQQKVVFGKCLAVAPRYLVLDEPTRGVDVGAKAELYEAVEEVAAAGTGVIVVSSELPELLRLCDRVVVLRDGRVAAEIDRADITEERTARVAFAEEGQATR